MSKKLKKKRGLIFAIYWGLFALVVIAFFSSLKLSADGTYTKIKATGVKYNSFVKNEIENASKTRFKLVLSSGSSTNFDSQKGTLTLDICDDWDRNKVGTPYNYFCISTKNGYSAVKQVSVISLDSKGKEVGPGATIWKSSLQGSGGPACGEKDGSADNCNVKEYTLNKNSGNTASPAAAQPTQTARTASVDQTSNSNSNQNSNTASSNTNGSTEIQVGVSIPGSNTNSYGYKTYICAVYFWALRIGYGLTLLMFIIAGYIYMVSAGDNSKISLSKDILTSSILGFVLLLVINLILSILDVSFKCVK